MSLEVYINGHRCDIDEKTKLAETKQVNDFFEIKDRQTNRTNSFKLPITPRNTEIFQMTGIVGSTTLLPYRIARIDVRRDGITTIESGSSTIRETTYENSYSVHAYDGIIDLFGVISERKLSELDFSDISTNTMSESSWLNSLNNTWQEGFNFPLADYGNISDVVECNYQAPALFVKYLWNKIFEESGFTYTYIGEDNIFSSEEFNETLLSITEGYSNEIDEEPEVKKLELAQSGNLSSNGIGSSPSSAIYYLNLIEREDTDSLHVSSNDRSRIRIKENGYYRLNVTGPIITRRMLSLSLYVEKNGVNIYIGGNFNDGTLNFDKLIYLEEGEELLVKFDVTYQNQDSAFSYDIQLLLFLDNNQIVLNFNQYFQDISQKDFVKDVMHHYGLMMQRKGKIYEFITIEDILTDQNNMEDWSAKLHSPTSEQYQIGNYAQNNWFKYSYDEENNRFADASFKIDDHTIPNEATLITRKFKAPGYSIKRINNKLLRLMPLWEIQKNNEVKPKKSKPYLIRLSRIHGTIDYKFLKNGNVKQYTGGIPYATFDNLDHNEILALRYSAFSNMLNQGKKLEIEMYLSVLDIYQLNFLRLKYIKQLGHFFYLNKVKSFQRGETTTCEMIQVRKFVNNGDYNNDYNQDYNI